MRADWPSSHAMSPRERLRELNDRVLWTLIDGPDESARDAAIDALIRDLVDPLIASVLKRFRREPDLRVEDIEELASLIALRLVRKVRAAAVDEQHAIQTLDGYVTRLTYNAVHDFRRQRHPERHRLKRNLRYILTRHPQFALWEGAENAVAGLSRWAGQAAQTPPPVSPSAAMRDKTRPVQALEAILRHIGHPVVFESLVDLVAEVWDVRDAIVARGDFPPDERRDALSSIEQRQYLAALWSEIRELSGNQRAALLLNLRDGGGSNALILFLLLNVAGVPEIAEAAGLSVDELNDLWDRLPLDDLAIADRLGLTRQQVINLRQSARMRLSRRMAKWR